jgi:hypothetical protein
MRKLILILFAGVALAQDKPTITPEMQSEYADTQVALTRATLKADVAHAELDKFEATQKAIAAVQKMQAVCPLELGADGRPRCAEKKEK